MSEARASSDSSPIDDALVLGGDLFAQVRVQNNRVLGVSEAMTSVKLFKVYGASPESAKRRYSLTGSLGHAMP